MSSVERSGLRAIKHASEQHAALTSTKTASESEALLADRALCKRSFG